MSQPAPIGGVILLREDGAALLQLRDNKAGLSAAGQWVFPGGHCEPGEAFEQCARREFFEETGYRCGQIWPLKEFEHTCPDTGRRFRLSFWWGVYDGVGAYECHEGQALRFVGRSEIEALPRPDYMTRVWDEALAELAKMRKDGKQNFTDS